MGVDDESGDSRKYCLDCEWCVVEGRSDDPSDAALEHFLETGHTIESIGHVPPGGFEAL